MIPVYKCASVRQNNQTVLPLCFAASKFKLVKTKLKVTSIDLFHCYFGDRI